MKSTYEQIKDFEKWYRKQYSREAVKQEVWAVKFDDWLIEKVENNDKESLFNYRQLAPNAKYAVPREEHIVPLFIAMGNGNSNKPQLLHQSYEYGTLSYICFEFPKGFTNKNICI